MVKMLNITHPDQLTPEVLEYLDVCIAKYGYWSSIRVPQASRQQNDLKVALEEKGYNVEMINLPIGEEVVNGIQLRVTGSSKKT